jgi:simple sugar transport system permease protein
VLALAGALLLFGGFVWLGGTSPLQTWQLLYEGAFGSALRNTLLRAAPLMLTALAVALPAQAGLIVIGGEGALALGALACAALPGLVARRPMAWASRWCWPPVHWPGPPGWRWPARCASTAASTRPSPACCWATSPSRSSSTWSKAAARPGQPEQTLHPAAGRGLRIGPIMGEAAFDSWLGDVHWGLVIGTVLCAGRPVAELHHPRLCLRVVAMPRPPAWWACPATG